MKKPISNQKEPNKIPITLNDTQWKLVEEYKGVLGEKRAEIIRNIILNWLLAKEHKVVK